MEQYPLNIKFLKKKFNPKILINFRDSLKVSLSLMLPQQTEESAVGTMCPPPWNRKLTHLHISIISDSYRSIPTFISDGPSISITLLVIQHDYYIE